MNRRPWTPGDDARLRVLVAEGATTAEAAGELGRGPEGVRKRRHRLGIPAAPQTDPARRAELMAILRRGATLTEAARQMGCCNKSVSKMARRLVRDGLLKRLGTHTFNVRYVPTHAWTRGN